METDNVVDNRLSNKRSLKFVSKIFFYDSWVYFGSDGKEWYCKLMIEICFLDLVYN